MHGGTLFGSMAKKSFPAADRPRSEFTVNSDAWSRIDVQPTDQESLQTGRLHGGCSRKALPRPRTMRVCRPECPVEGLVRIPGCLVAAREGCTVASSWSMVCDHFSCRIESEPVLPGKPGLEHRHFSHWPPRRPVKSRFTHCAYCCNSGKLSSHVGCLSRILFSIRGNFVN